VRRRKYLTAEPWHVFSRGARRLELFRDDEDRHTFLKILEKALIYSGCLLWAYALMPNHYHLILYGSSPQLTRCMHRLNLWYSVFHNRKYRMSGHAFDGPYRAYRQKSIYLLLRKIAYVLLNPFRAGFGPEPCSYPWTCLPRYLALPGSPLEVDLKPLFDFVDRDPQQAKARFQEAYDAEKTRALARKPLSHSAYAMQAEQFDCLLELARRRAGELGMEPALLAIYWGMLTGVRPKVIADKLGRASSAAISQTMYRLKLRIDDDPALAQRLALP
jgi:REP element-mobilizing transposase RayT